SETGSDAADSETGSDTADSETESDTNIDEPEIAGTYTDAYGGTHTVTDESWTADFTGYSSTVDFTIVNNSDDYAVGLNDGGTTWSRYDWTMDGNDLYYCQIAYDAATEEDAEANDSADRSALESDGCDGFAWSLLTPVK
ncbi:MAG: hypothetical protein JXR91_04685, partial [Deltaproteobacteria bacterium]|nr:hypothetical protein [Deltaproteobacteria bacterium]